MRLGVRLPKRLPRAMHREPDIEVKPDSPACSSRFYEDLYCPPFRKWVAICMTLSPAMRIQPQAGTRYGRPSRLAAA